MKKAKFSIMNNYNMFALISNVVETINNTYTKYKKEDIILPMKFNISDKIKNYISWKFNIQI